MKSIKIAGLCLVAAFAFGAVAATSAMAEGPPPVYNECVKVEKTPVTYVKVKEKTTKKAEERTPESTSLDEGLYEEKGCKKLEGPGVKDVDTSTGTSPNATSGDAEWSYTGPEGKYERKEVPGTGLAYTTKIKTVALTVEGKTVTCKKGEGAGAWYETGSASEEITLEKCELPAETVHNIAKPEKTKLVKVPCTTSGEALGTIKTNSLSLLPKYLSSGESESDVGVLLLRFFGPIAEFECVGESAGYESTTPVTVELEGHLVGTSSNAGKGETTVFKVSGGKQELTHFWSEGAESEAQNLFTEPGETEATLEMTEEASPKNVSIF